MLPRFAGNFWYLQLLGWVGLAVATFPFKLHYVDYNWTGAMMVTLIRDIPAFCYSLLMWRVYRVRCSWMDGHLFKLALLVAGMAIFGAAVDFAYIQYIGLLIGPEAMQNPDYLVMTIGYRMLLFAVWSVFYFGIKALQARQAQADALLDAEMQMLRAQINPHFFFNALNTIQAGAGEDPKALSQLVQNLAGYLRYILKHRRNLRVPLGEEYDAAIDYLAVEKARFCEGLELKCSIEPAARKVQVPGVLIQPLLENAIKHGRRTAAPPLKVALEVTLISDSEVLISVRNSGQWVPEIKAGAGQVNGVGLENLRRRLRLSYPGDGRVLVKVDKENGVKVELRLPAEGFS